jgi:hypothetical protein
MENEKWRMENVKSIDKLVGVVPTVVSSRAIWAG